jgi:UDP-3-O-[3-hydroxymyristoyl] glucosamine N-acyltransferase
MRLCGGKPTYEIEKILGWLERNNYDYVFCGDDQTEIGGFSSLQNYKINSLTWIKKEEIYDSLGRPESIACAVVRKGVTVDFKNVITVENSKEIFFAVRHEFWEERRKVGSVGEGTVISDRVVLAPTVVIGCGCSIVGNVAVGEHTVIEHNVVI